MNQVNQKELLLFNQKSSSRTPNPNGASLCEKRKVPLNFPMLRFKRFLCRINPNWNPTNQTISRIFFWPSRPQPLNLLRGDVEANVTSFRGAEQDILPVWRNTMDFLPLSWTSKDFHVFQRCKSNNGSKLSEILVWKGRPLLSSSPPVTMNPKVRNLTLSIVLLSFARIPEQRKRRRRPLRIKFAKDGSLCVLRRGGEI